MRKRRVFLHSSASMYQHSTKRLVFVCFLVFVHHYSLQQKSSRHRRKRRVSKIKKASSTSARSNSASTITNGLFEHWKNSRIGCLSCRLLSECLVPDFENYISISGWNYRPVDYLDAVRVPFVMKRQDMLKNDIRRWRCWNRTSNLLHPAWCSATGHSGVQF